VLRPADKEKVINSREKVIILNPTSLSEYHSKILHLLLDQQRKNKVKVLEKNKEYQVTIPSTDQVSGNYVVKVMLTNTLVYRAKKLPGTSKKRIRYSVVSDVLLGAGDYGGVYLVSGTLVPRQNDKLIYKTHKRRAIKIQEHNFLKPVEIAVNEAELSQYVPYLHAKKLTFLKDESGKNYKSYMV
jgi:hypothetical protein